MIRKTIIMRYKDCIKLLLLSYAFVVNSFAQASEPPLGIANDFSAYVFGDFSSNNSNSDGAIATGGNLVLEGYGVATNPNIIIPEYSLLVEGSAQYNNGRIHRGKVRVEGSILGVSPSVIAGLPESTVFEQQTLPFSIVATKPHYLKLATSLSESAPNGVVEFKWGGLYLQGDETSPIQVFNVEGSQLSQANTFSVKGLPEDATVIFNITGEDVSFKNAGLNSLSAFTTRALFNFYEAKTLTFSGISIKGSVLAPLAAINAANGDLLGTVIADSWNGSMHIVGQPFDGVLFSVLTVDITTPETLLTVGTSPIRVSGVVTGNAHEFTLNGVPITLGSDNTFSANVELKEGFNTIVARVTNSSSEQVTDSIVISLDLTPPYLTIDSHQDQQVVYSDTITVTGLVNDIVRGTVEAQQAQVEVNGIKAVISNRSYAVQNVPLTEGNNTILITTVDQAGNSASISREVVYKIPVGKKLVVQSGQNQTAKIGDKAAKKLVVKVLDENGQTVANETVIFRVIQGAGVVGAESEGYSRAIIVQSNEEGLAETTFQLGYRTGVANHKVRAQVVGYENEVIFYTSAESELGDKISVNSGNNQRGIVGQNLPAPFIVAVTDKGANTVKNARVRFDVIRGGGVFQNEESSITVTTDSDGRASAQLQLGDETGLDIQRVQATLIDAKDGVKLTAGFMASGFIAGDPGDTSITGVVLNNQDQPMEGVTIRVEDTDRTAITDSQGQFEVLQVPVGPVHLIADGSTAQLAGEYPSLAYQVVTVPGAKNPLSSPIYMVKLDTENAVTAGSEDAVITLDNYPGFKLEIAKNSITFPDGSREGLVSVTAVNASKVPMAPPNGMQPQMIVTIQPVGATFDPPARLTLPNVDGHAPGAQVEMYSFDHDLEEFVAIGLGFVSEDGTVVSSSPGVGVVKAGWHCGSQPGGSGTAHNCPTCQKCEGDDCVQDAAQNEVVLEKQTPEDCKLAKCKGLEDDDSDRPKEDKIEGDCSAPGCSGGSIDWALLADPTDITEEDAKCKTCGGTDNKELIADKDKENLLCDDSGDIRKSCWVCSGGKCGVKCNASSEVIPALGKDFIANPLKKLSEKFDRAIQRVTRGLGSGGIALTVKGKYTEKRECCPDCTVAPTEDESEKGFKFYEYSGGTEASVKISLGLTPDQKKSLVIKESFGPEFRFVAGITSTPALLVDTKLGGEAKGKYSERCPGGTCGGAKAGGEMKFEANAGLGLALSVDEYVPNLEYGCRDDSFGGKFRAPNDDCWKVSVGGTGEAGTKLEGNLISISGEATFPLPNTTCLSESYTCTVKALALEVVPHGSIKAAFPLPWYGDWEAEAKYDSNNYKIKVFDGFTGDCDD